jgi:enoyl-CoA hydratase
MAEVLFERTDRVAVFTFDDGKANAFRPSTLDALAAALDAAERADVGALVIAGRPGFFSGGLDLKVLPTLDRPAQQAMFGRYAALMLRLWTFPRPTVAAVGGHALAGGAILALTADVRLAVDGPYRFGLTEVAIGLPLPTFGVELARAAVSGPTLTEATAHGRAHTLQEALQRGFFESLHSADALLPQALERARGLSRLNADAYARTKRALVADGLARAEGALATEIPGFLDAFAAMR